MQTPDIAYRARPPNPAADVMVTAATSSLAASLGSNLITALAPIVNVAYLPQLISKLITGYPALGIPGSAPTDSISGQSYFNGYLLSELGLQFGSSASPDLTYYILSTLLKVRGGKIGRDLDPSSLVCNTSVWG